MTDEERERRADELLQRDWEEWWDDLPEAPPLVPRSQPQRRWPVSELVNVINAASDSCEKARRFGCVIEIDYKASFSKTVHVRVMPIGATLGIDDREPQTEVLPVSQLPDELDPDTE